MMQEKIERTFQRAGTADARHSLRDRAVLDVQIAGADGPSVTRTMASRESSIFGTGLSRRANLPRSV